MQLALRMNTEFSFKTWSQWMSTLKSYADVRCFFHKYWAGRVLSRNLEIPFNDLFDLVSACCKIQYRFERIIGKGLLFWAVSSPLFMFFVKLEKKARPSKGDFVWIIYFSTMQIVSNLNSMKAYGELCMVLMGFLHTDVSF